MSRAEERGFWQGEDNAEFYNAVADADADADEADDAGDGKVKMDEYAIAAGLEGGADLHFAKEQNLLPAKMDASIFEVGGGSGRIRRVLHSIGYNNVTVLERNEKFVQMLKKDWPEMPVIEADLKDLPRQPEVQKEYELILWMWCGICDFAFEEQIPMLRILLNQLSKRNGRLLVDVPIDTNATTVAGIMRQEHRIEREQSGLPEYRGFVPGIEDMKRYARTLNVGVFVSEPYQTKTRRSRRLYSFFHVEAERPISAAQRRESYEGDRRQYHENRDAGASSSFKPA